jgi:hypothetical protein
MTDERPPTDADRPQPGLSDADLPDLTSADETRVRRLLADARETAPMPAEVVARLDGVLADLRASEASAAVTAAVTEAADEPVRGERTAVVVPISRWRKRIAGGLVAAAATVLGVAVVPQLVSGGGGQTASEGDAASQAEDSGADESGADTPESAPGATTQKEGPASVEPPEAFASEQLDELDVASLTRAELRRTALNLRSGKTARTQDSAAAPCGTAAAGARVVPVRYDGAAAALVYLPVTGARQPVELWTCPGPDVVETFTLPAP